MLDAYQHCTPNIRLVLKGTISPDVSKKILRLENKPMVFPLSPSFKEMRNVISGIDIGFIGLSYPNLNNHFASKATGQLVEFTNYAIPVIVYGLEELGDFVEKNHCGKYITLDDFENLPKAIDEIVNQYSYYSSGASSVFNKYYNLESYLNDLFD